MATIATEELAHPQDTASDYAKVRAELESVKHSMASMSNVLRQLGALFAVIKKQGPRSHELIDLGHYLADDWAGTASGIEDRAEQVLAETPEKNPHRRIWADCECPDCRTGASAPNMAGDA